MKRFRTIIAIIGCKDIQKLCKLQSFCILFFSCLRNGRRLIGLYLRFRLNIQYFTLLFHNYSLLKPALHESAFFGHSCTHLRHWIHSVPFFRLRLLSNISTSIGQALMHLLHLIHFCSAQRIRNKE